ncbi:signal peptidase II [Sphingobium nicotianae]|uniref:Lipoprotein signal peptidase n=1 Tax=Sphingobium nicotianae TaxID=2782607 RepID=A0A9X1DDP1_9SPHN|nr:signal peptidase II [Sphingobium nicotianae]MBT2187969.1 signal peptidase II [Sphingobium nicotianae]
MSVLAINHRRLGVATAGVIVLVDQLLKFFVLHTLQLASRGSAGIELLPFFNLTYTENKGVSMGFFYAETNVMRWLLVVMTLVIAGFVAWWMWREKGRDDAFALGLVLGGAIGNIIDRVRLGFVIDYADFHIGGWRPFLIFNLADAAITIGVLILLARALLLREKTAVKESR